MARQSAPRHPVRSRVEGATINERIDAAATAAGVSTTELAKAAGVTWAAAKRWRLDPPKGAEPRSEHLYAIAEVCGVTVEELLGVLDGQEPPFEAWQAFQATTAAQRLSADQRRALAGLPFPPGQQPTVGTYLLLAEAMQTLEPR